MSIKASISLTEQQNDFARALVANGRYASLSAVLQHGLDLLRHETELKESETNALKQLLSTREAGPFISLAEGEVATQTMIAQKKKQLGV